MNTIPASNLKGKVHVGIITVRQDEFMAIVQRLDSPSTVEGRNLYEYSIVEEKGVVVCRCSEQGNLNAQSIASNLLLDFSPPWLILVGIGGGFPDNEYTLGDVLIANRLHDFSVTAAVEGRNLELDIRGGPMHPDVDKLIAHIPVLQSKFGSWNTKEAIRASRPRESIPNKLTQTNPSFYGEEEWRQKVYDSLSNQTTRDQPCVWVAPNASSNILLKDTTLAKEWKNVARSIASVEMELAGVYEAIRKHHECRLLSIRGISDIVGYKRNPAWTEYACHTAASFCFGLLQSNYLKCSKEISQKLPLFDRQDSSKADPEDIDSFVHRIQLLTKEAIVANHGKIRLLDNTIVSLDSLYVDVYYLEKPSNRSLQTASSIFGDADSRKNYDRIGLGGRRERHCGQTIVTNETRIMLFGKPGSGKTTFLKYLAIECANGHLFPCMIPLYIEIKVVPSKFNILDMIINTFHVSPTEAIYLLENGKIFFLIDGIDESPLPIRESITKICYLFAREYHNNRYILSCRTQTIEYIDDSFKAIEIADFTEEQTNIFIYNYFANVKESIEDSKQIAKNCIELLKNTENIQELSLTPILLSLICLMYESDADFPYKRSEIYKKATDILLGRLDTFKGLSRLDTDISTKTKEKLLAELAFNKLTCADSFILFEHSELEQSLSRILNVPQNKANTILKNLESNHGLLIERASGIWSFSHLSFQEYFAAKYVFDNYISNPPPEVFYSLIYESRWHEVFLILSELTDISSILIEISKKMSNDLNSNNGLHQFIEWIIESVEKVRPKQSPLAKRATAMTFALDFVSILHQDATFFQYNGDELINLSSALAKSLDKSDDYFQRDVTWHIVVGVGNQFDSALVGNSGELLEPMINSAIEHGLSLGQTEGYFDLPELQVVDGKYLSELLSALKNILDNPPSNRFDTPENYNHFVKSIRQIILQSFKFDPSWIIGMEKKQQEYLAKYIRATMLIIECLDKSSNIPEKTRELIENNLLV